MSLPPRDRRALVISLSVLESDPRVRRQIDWLTGAGWTVDTLGLGDHPAPEVRDHFPLTAQAGWVRSRPGSVLIYGLLPKRTAFRVLSEDRIPDEAKLRVRRGDYALVVFNDKDLIPWVLSGDTFHPATGTHLHLDLHEYHEPRIRASTPWTALTARYAAWVRSLIGHPAFATRSTVASRLADFYAEEFGIERPALVRNSPPFVEQSPSPVDPATIRLLFHGLASPARGLQEIVDAVRQLDGRVTATFMLVGNPHVVAEIAQYARGLEDRVRIVPPAPMREISERINPYDLEVMFYRPTHRNLEFALPNKFFEAIQGRLGVVVGESPMMAEIVRRYSNGVVVPGWSADDLAATLGSLTTERVAELKQASHRAAGDLNAEAEGVAFLSAIEAAGRRG